METCPRRSAGDPSSDDLGSRANAGPLLGATEGPAAFVNLGRRHELGVGEHAHGVVPQSKADPRSDEESIAA